MNKENLLKRMEGKKSEETVIARLGNSYERKCND